MQPVRAAAATAAPAIASQRDVRMGSSFPASGDGTSMPPLCTLLSITQVKTVSSLRRQALGTAPEAGCALAPGSGLRQPQSFRPMLCTKAFSPANVVRANSV